MNANGRLEGTLKQNASGITRWNSQCYAKVVYLCYRAQRLKYEDITFRG